MTSDQWQATLNELAAMSDEEFASHIGEEYSGESGQPVNTLLWRELRGKYPMITFGYHIDAMPSFTWCLDVAKINGRWTKVTQR